MSGLRACALSELNDDLPLAVEVDGVGVAVVRTDGQIYAIRDLCSHAAVALSEGDVEHGSIECWMHGSRFDLATGQPQSLPAFEPVDVYPVTIDGDDVVVDVHHPLTASTTPMPTVRNAEETRA